MFFVSGIPKVKRVRKTEVDLVKFKWKIEKLIFKASKEHAFSQVQPGKKSLVPP